MKNLLWISVYFVFSNYSIGQTTLIPDPNFETHLVFWGCDTLPLNGSVPTASIDTVTIVDVFASSIGDMTGIEDFISLEYLNCGYNYSVGNITLPATSTLEYVNVDYTGISLLDVTQNPGLERLYCWHNQLSSIDLSQCPLLKKLRCSYNQLIQLDLSQNNQLTYLNCFNNQITSLDVSGMTNLNEIECNGNQLTSLDFSQNFNLTFVKCFNNQITTLEIGQIEDLGRFECQNNLITSLNMSLNPYLDVFDCSENDMNCLNLRGRYSDWLDEINTTGNPNLTCIEVDDTLLSAANWGNIDNWTNFSDDCDNSCSTASLNNITAPTFDIYPNPTKDLIHLSNTDQIEFIQVLKLNGNEILFSQSPVYSINLADIPKGVYLIRISTQNKIINKRVIKI